MTEASTQPATPPPGPVAPVRPTVDPRHGETRVDDYVWLRDKTDPAVAAYLNAENVYADHVLAPTTELQNTLYGEMLGRIKQTDLSVPYRDGGWLYYSRTEEGRQYPIYCRRRDTPESREHMLLDANALAAGQPFFALGTFQVSDDGRWLLYSTDYTGFRQYTLRVRDLDSGLDLLETRDKVVTAAWAADNRTLLYSVEDHAKRAHRLWRWTRGASADVLIHQEDDERFSVYVERSRSRSFLFMQVASHTTSEIWVCDAHEPAAPWRCVRTRQQDIEYDIDHRGDRFYVRINDTGRHFRLVEAPVSLDAASPWPELVPHRVDVMLEGVLAFADHLVLFEREQGLTQLTVRPFTTGVAYRIPFPEPVYSSAPSVNREFESALFRYSYQSFVTPTSIYDFDTRTGTSRLLKQTEVLGGYDPSRYRSERLYVPASDGTAIPVSLLSAVDTPRDGTAAMLLTGYGAYGLSTPATFSSNVFSLVDRGVTYGIAHVRGGGDLGKLWHDAGRMANKHQSFDDFIAVADGLVARRYVARHRLAIAGGSAGGLLIGAVLNARPDLCRAAVMWVPFLDVINSMLDERLPLTVGEYEEWGNPKHAQDYAVMRRYCPYTNLRATDYPSVLIRTSFNDSQVMYWEPAKYVAKLRTLKTDSRPLLLKTNMSAGHGGASGRYDRLREVALDYAFVLWQTGAWTPSPL